MFLLNQNTKRKKIWLNYGEKLLKRILKHKLHTVMLPQDPWIVASAFAGHLWHNGAYQRPTCVAWDPL